MKMKERSKHLISALLSTIVLVSLLVATAYASYSELHVSRYKQEQRNWCWAACARMAADYVCGFTIPSQAEIVLHIKKSLVDKTGTISETANAITYATSGVKQASYTSQGNPWTFQNVIKSIDNLRPVVPLVNDGSSGHYYVICGYEASTGRITVIDPGDAGRYTCSWNDFQNGNTASGWRDSRPHAYTVFFSDWAFPTTRMGE